MFDYLALFEEYLTVELGLAQNTRLAYLRDLRLLQKTFNFKSSEELLGVNRQQLLAYLVQKSFSVYNKNIERILSDKI